MSSKDIFTKAFNRFGHPMPTPDIDPSSLKCCYNPAAFMPDIYCDYIDTDELNAMATIYKDQELVAIFYGLINFVTPYYCALLADPSMFPVIGDPSKDSTDKLIEFQKVRISYLKKYPTVGTSAPSVCPVRARATMQLIYCFQLFLHAHEVAHIVLGHLDLLKDEFGLTAYEELSVNALSEEEGNIRRALELQADQSAALTSLHLFRANIARKNDEFDDADLLWSIAVEFLFALFALIMIHKGKGVYSTHPSPLVRWISVYLYVTKYSEEHGIDVLKFRDGSSSSIAPIMNWLKRNGFIESSQSFSKIDIEQATNEMYSTWDTLRPYEEKLKHYRLVRGNRVRSHV